MAKCPVELQETLTPSVQCGEEDGAEAWNSSSSSFHPVWALCEKLVDSVFS